MSHVERALSTRRGLQRRYLVVYRTLADPRYLDPRIDASERPLGSIFSLGGDPIKGNYGEGLARVMSARGWLSTWSGLASRAALEDTLPDVRVPTLVIHARSDQEIFPSEVRAIFEAIGSEERGLVEVPGADHYLRPLADAAADEPVARVCRETLLPWLRQHCPPR
jgi:pimeloyl-ACP methyl ester carboxylesterase